MEAKKKTIRIVVVGTESVALPRVIAERLSLEKAATSRGEQVVIRTELSDQINDEASLPVEIALFSDSIEVRCPRIETMSEAPGYAIPIVIEHYDGKLGLRAFTDEQEDPVVNQKWEILNDNPFPYEFPEAKAKEGVYPKKRKALSVFKVYSAAYGELHDGLSDMIEEGRLNEGLIPDDYQWLVKMLSGKCLKADKLAKDFLEKGGPDGRLLSEMRDALAIAEGVIAWALDHGASKDGTGAIHKKVKSLLKRSNKVLAAEDVKDTGIYKYLDASTGHITEKDMRLLDRPDRPRLEHRVVSVPHEYGAWVHALEGSEANDYAEIRVGGFSESFVQLLKFAKRNGCAWINLDQDGLNHGDTEGLSYAAW